MSGRVVFLLWAVGGGLLASLLRADALAYVLIVLFAGFYAVLIELERR